MWCWGSNQWGQLGDAIDAGADGGLAYWSPTPVVVSGLPQGVRALAVGDTHSCALADGGVWCWGDSRFGELGTGKFEVFNPTPTPVLGLPPGVESVTAGTEYTCALVDGGVWCWGYDDASSETLPSPASNVPVPVTFPR